jgi:hypothetical protein
MLCGRERAAAKLLSAAFLHFASAGEYRAVKHKYDAFFETDLDSILRNHGSKTIIIVGTATNVCCESTARSGFFRHYQVAFANDCNATFDEGMHQASLKTIDMRVMTTEELLNEMRSELGRNDRAAANEPGCYPTGEEYATLQTSGLSERLTLTYSNGLGDMMRPWRRLLPDHLAKLLRSV